jgi:NAD(P)-dependent dehydrogenase (short-subunit alcohol dehydrogenase family)
MSIEQFKLDGRVALVTGGSKGLGKEIARELASAGADVVVTSRHIDESKAVAEEIRDDIGTRTLAIKMDVSARDQVDIAVTRIEKEFGRIDILINNAGTNIRGQMIELEDSDWHTVINVNLHGVMYCARAVGKGMIERRYGRIVNMSSVVGLVAVEGRAAYASSKGAVIQLTKVLALEWAKYNITVNALCPGPFLTDINIPLIKDKELYKNITKDLPLGRFGNPTEITGAALYFASDASSYVTGSTLLIDGGIAAK